MEAYWEAELETLLRRQLEMLQLDRLRFQLERLYQGSPFFKPEEVSRMVVFLMDPENSYVTGGFYAVDGGVSAR